MNPFKTAEKVEDYAKEGLSKLREIILLLKDIRDLLRDK